MKKIILLFLLFTILPFSNAYALSDKIVVDMHYIVIDPSEDGAIKIKHMVNYTNAGDEEFKGDGGKSVLDIVLPQGAMDLVIMDESLGASITEKGFTTSKPMPPKETQVVPYSYSMPAGIPIKLTLDYPLQVMQVLVPEGKGSLVIEGAKSSNAGLMQFEERNFWLYNVEGITSGQEIKLIHDKNSQPTAPEAAGNGETEAAADDQASTETVTRKAPQFHNPGHIRLWYQSPLKKFNPHILLIVLGAILAAGIGYHSYFKRKARQQDLMIDGDKEEQLFKQLLARQAAIMDKIIELEELHSQGEMNEEDYAAKLAAYKEHLIKVKLALREFVE